MFRLRHITAAAVAFCFPITAAAGQHVSTTVCVEFNIFDLAIFHQIVEDEFLDFMLVS